jgi:acyl-coenzyme A synthetase/AMP-(fatty) acid ligase
MSTTIEAPANATAVLIDRHISETNGNRPALRYGEKRYAYHDVAALMNRAGNLLRRFGITPGQEALLLVTPSPALLACLLGAMKIGAVTIVVPGTEPPEAVATLIASRRPRLIIADAARVSALGDAASTSRLLVVGGTMGAQQSFVEAMRESGSSLGRATVPNDAPAVAVAAGGTLVWATHGQVVAGDAARGVGLLDGWDLGAALQRFARCEEVSIS